MYIIKLLKKNVPTDSDLTTKKSKFYDYLTTEGAYENEYCGIDGKSGNQLLLEYYKANNIIEHFTTTYENFADAQKLPATYKANFKVVGVFVEKNSADKCCIVSDNLFSQLLTAKSSPYSMAVGVMPKTKADIKRIVETGYRVELGVGYALKNDIIYTIDNIEDACNEIASVLFYMSVGFALFASLMMANFISTSIAYKKQEIGILRAIGSRSTDVLKIFFSEAFIIASINYVLSLVSTFIASALLCNYLKSAMGVAVSFLTAGIRQVALLFLVSMLVAVLASYLLVRSIASKRPIDAIRNR